MLMNQLVNLLAFVIEPVIPQYPRFGPTPMRHPRVIQPHAQMAMNALASLLFPESLFPALVLCPACVIAEANFPAILKPAYRGFRPSFPYPFADVAHQSWAEYLKNGVKSMDFAISWGHVTHRGTNRSFGGGRPVYEAYPDISLQRRR